MGNDQRNKSEAIVNTSFPSKDPRRADQIERAILAAAREAGLASASEGHDLNSRHLTFAMGTPVLSNFLELVQTHCRRAHPTYGEIKTRIVVKM